jgi:excisionase family DNA binding protein
MIEQPVLLSVEEFSATLKITVSCTRRWILEHRIATVKLGRLVRIPHTELERLINVGLRPVRPARPQDAD